MNNTSFAEILDGLEKDVFDLISNLEMQISSRLASGNDSPRDATKEPAKPFQPKWRGLRGALRWLWKGHSRDNPDYAHLYGNETKRESKGGRPTLAEYLSDVRTIDGFADEIFFEAFGNLIAEANISDLLKQFRMDFRNVILKYKNLIKSSVPESPEVAPAAAGQKPASPGVPTREPKPTAAEKAPEVQASEPAPSQKDSEGGSDAEGEEEAPAQKDASPEENGQEVATPASQDDDERSVASGSEQSEKAQRKPKSHSDNIGRWFKEAMEAKKKGGDGLNPKPEWLNAKGLVKPEKLPWVIAWMGTKSHKDLHKDEDVRSELQSAIGSSFKDFVPQIAKKKSDSLVGYLRKKMPMVSDEEFKRLVSELYGSEYEGAGISSQKKREKKGSADVVASAEGEKDDKPRGPDIQEIRLKTLSALYDGMDSKEKILTAIQDKIVKPAFEIMQEDDSDDSDDSEYFAKWWRSFKRERLGDDQEDVDSLIVRINSGAMFDDILKNSEVSKNKPEKKIKLRNLMDMLKG